eukprot:TRINITY_DN3690_c0_g1_i1.p1 TRINITY_DN3690_c0_g1~~TRINITY_DN3690_c0_g1_i1.p1  ORF type:complete len:437 (+),score=124.13 TRINITY_DN3690_c0_g1_i1:32-1312(+)
MSSSTSKNKPPVIRPRSASRVKWIGGVSKLHYNEMKIATNSFKVGDHAYVVLSTGKKKIAQIESLFEDDRGQFAEIRWFEFPEDTAFPQKQKNELFLTQNMEILPAESIAEKVNVRRVKSLTKHRFGPEVFVYNKLYDIEKDKILNITTETNIRPFKVSTLITVEEDVVAGSGDEADMPPDNNTSTTSTSTSTPSRSSSSKKKSTGTTASTSPTLPSSSSPLERNDEKTLKSSSKSNKTKRDETEENGQHPSKKHRSEKSVSKSPKAPPSPDLSDSSSSSSGEDELYSTGPKVKGSKSYAWVTIANERYQPGDSALFSPDQGSVPYIGRIDNILPASGKNYPAQLEVTWFFRYGDLPTKVQKALITSSKSHEVYVSLDTTKNHVSSVLKKCNVVCCEKDPVDPGPDNGANFFYKLKWDGTEIVPVE